MALSAGVTPVTVVLGCQAEAVHTALGRVAGPVQVVMNWRWQEGMSTSVQVGLSALPPETDAALFLQCDQPLVTADLLQALVIGAGWTGFLGTLGLKKDYAERKAPKDATLEKTLERAKKAEEIVRGTGDGNLIGALPPEALEELEKDVRVAQRL